MDIRIRHLMLHHPTPYQYHLHQTIDLYHHLEQITDQNQE